ncbi:hypothetical protein UFOVP32_29 [uncultured Caudovirales phage]|uniref:Uncharacterized protein n=1 Tax=uncultured Caudovirales phage TaxID=2100421 RepID=A0A6J5KMR2_9CAUD|nr:hypothetical protein UFOVP32_29 [uncultured Caudovirales phage]CAB4123711.1 hypothetical protein UFOVP50_47 [uncultured Caudovirales phage]
MAHDLGSLFESVAHITRIAAEKPRASLLAGKSAEQMAMESVSAKMAADELMAQLRNEFIAAHGLAAWDQVVAATTKLKKEMRAAEVQAANEQAALLDELSFWSTVILVIIALLTLVALLIYTLTHR